MSITEEQFDKALAEFQQFGPRRRIPLEQRWREVLPEIDVSEYPALQARCKEIQGFAVSLAEQVRDKKISDEIARKNLEEKYSSLTPEQLGRTWSQAMYVSMY